MKAEIRKITSGDAKKMLAKSTTINRHLNMASVNRLADSMKSGDFIVNGEPIIIDQYDNVLDGHHRLAALSKVQDCEIETLVVEGVDATVMKSLDIGKSRSLADQFEMVAGLNGVVAKVVSHIYTATSGRPMGRGNANARWDRYNGYDGAYRLFSEHKEAVKWTLANAYGIEIHERRRASKPKVLFNRFAKEQPFIWSCIGLIAEANKCMGEAIRDDLLAVKDGKGSVTAQTLIALVTAESHQKVQRRTREFYAARIMLGLNAMIDGRQITKIQYSGVAWPTLDLDAARCTA